MIIEKKRLIIDFSQSLELNNAALFIGAGFSAASGYFDWVKLLMKPALYLKLEIEKEKHDLTTLAQIYVNNNNRQSLNSILTNEFSKYKEITENHKIIAKLPIQTVWTTNYDKLIEDAFKSEGKKCDVKHEDKQLKSATNDRDVVLYKMHGDIDHPSDLVITRDDYQYFDKKHELFREVLEADLVTKTFLFLGFSFTDPNLASIIGKLKILLDGSPRNHYCIMRKVNFEECKESNLDYDYESRKQEYLIEDLKRFGILVCLVDEYSEITEILSEIEKINRRKTIFISGAAVDYSPFSEENGKYFIQNLAKKISLSSRNYKIVNGFGVGVGEFLINGVVSASMDIKNKKIQDHLTIMPFPTHEKEKSKKYEIYSRYRKEMIERSGISIFIFGNKYLSNKSNEIVISNGMIDEFKTSIENNTIPIPLAITGSASKEILDLILNKKYRVDSFKNYTEIVNEILKFNDIDVNSKRDIDKMVNKIVVLIDLLNNLEREEN